LSDDDEIEVLHEGESGVKRWYAVRTLRG
jgi:hypothetical protein